MRRRWLLLAAACLTLGVLLRHVFTAMGFCGFLCLCAVPVLLLWGFLEARQGQRPARIARRALSLSIAMGFALFGILECRVVAAGHSDYESGVEAVVVLGAGVNGAEPSLSLLTRLEAALDYLAGRPEIPVVVSGASGEGEEISEAACMAAWLIGHGVEAGRVHLEERARSTAENVARSREILSGLGLDPEAPVAVVTSDYHLYRASLYWDGPGFVPVAAHMPPRYLPLTVNYYIREVFGVVYLLVLG